MNTEIDGLVLKLKTAFDTKSDILIPSDPTEIKMFYKNITSNVKNIADNYLLNLQTLNDVNKRIKFQAKDYYERYKEIKKNFKKDRKDLKNKNKLLEYESKTTSEETSKTNYNLVEVKNELAFFKNKIGLSEEKENKDEEINLMIDILNSVKLNGVDIYTGLNDTQKASLNEIMDKYKETKDDNFELSKNVNLIDNQNIITEEDMVIYFFILG